jgi:hypothetical protein
LSLEGVAAVAELLILRGHAEWVDASKSGLRVNCKTPSTIAVEMYDWARRASAYSTVFTLFELVQGDDLELVPPSLNKDPDVVMQALKVLESEQKCMLYAGPTWDECGVKFLER